jgi:RNase P subunit RPR2
MSGLYYYVEQKPNVSYEESYVRSLCKECKEKLFPDEKMIFYQGKFGPFTIHCYACEKVLHQGEQCQEM